MPDKYFDLFYRVNLKKKHCSYGYKEKKDREVYWDYNNPNYSSNRLSIEKRFE